MARPPRKSKLYTRTGDRGQTGLFGGRRVPKDHPRVAAYGAIDELNAALGLAISYIRQRRLVASLQTIQNELFNIGAELATVGPTRSRRKESASLRLEGAKTEWLESLIDEYDARVPPLRTFVLPSGTTAASALHVARTVCRRAEREVVALARKQPINAAIMTYLNRLSDLLFVLARYVNKAARRRELLWEKDA
ncbi:MAG: cob(I)yrinic acid a,c-diamide adenosyltransferase [Chloroflexi bacterium]|nr:cob(I)yrinic acid a,c-diamide adenosyltransferase [Chloroflexota bacterium]